MPSRVALSIACALALSWWALGPRTWAGETSIEQLVRDEEADTAPRWVGVYRARLSYPQTFSAGVGALRARLPRAWECKTPCPLSGLLLQVEPGLHGGQISAGYGKATGRERGGFLTDPYVAFAAKGVLLRTWGDANLTPPSRTYVGVEFAYTVVRLNFSIGTFRRIDDGPEGRWLTTFGMGWGF